MVAKSIVVIEFKFLKVFLYRDYVDMRKSMNGLSIIVEESLGRNPLDGSLYIFSNRSRKILKMLYWDKTGYAIWHKRLEEARYKWPRYGEQSVSLSTEQLHFLLSGYDVWKMKPHKTLSYTITT